MKRFVALHFGRPVPRATGFCARGGLENRNADETQQSLTRSTAFRSGRCPRESRRRTFGTGRSSIRGMTEIRTG